MTTPSTTSPAAALYNQFKQRGVELRVENTTVIIHDTAVPFKRIQLHGGIRLPGDFQKIERVKSGLVRILESEGKTEMSVGDTQEPPFIVNRITDKSSAKRTRRANEAGLEPPMAQERPVIVFAPLGAQGLKKGLQSPQNWMKGRTKPKPIGPTPKKRHGLCSDAVYPGARFGKWTVLSCCDTRTARGLMRWLCRCDCGSEREVLGGSLRRVNGPSRSCGCAQRRIAPVVWDGVDWTQKNVTIAKALKCSAERVRDKRLEVAPGSLCLSGGRPRKPPLEVGQRYGRLVLVSPVGEKVKGGKVKWTCACDCGNSIVIETNFLRRPTRPTRSCGCMRIEAIRAAGAKKRAQKSEPG